jgi:hypothetical protein
MAIERPRPNGPRTSRPNFGPRCGPLIALALLVSAPPARADGTPDDYEAPILQQIDRSISLVRPEQGEQGDHRRRWLTWRVEYRVKNAGKTTLIVEPETIFATVEGWASNSRAEGHGVPRRADHALSVGDDLESACAVIEHDDPTKSCGERATLQVWPEHLGTPEEPGPGGSCEPLTAPIDLGPGEVLGVRLRLEHRHHLHGPVEPLYGARELTLRIGPAAFRDEFDLDDSIPVDRDMDRLSPIPDERRDPRVYFSAPDSLYLDAALSGFRSFQFRDLKVPRDEPMVLRYPYFRSTDSVGTVRAELKQYQDVPNAYRVLTEAKKVEELDELGEWVLVEHRFRSEPTATTMQLRFLLDCEGDGPSAAWIDDVVLEPIGRSSE